MATVAKGFDKIIKDARERKKNEALADRIFSKDRRQSAPSKLKATPGGSLASRVGVKKQRAAPVGNRRASVPAGNVNGEWTHDLHGTVNADHREPRGGSLSSRITLPGAKKAVSAAQRKTRLAAVVDRMEVDPAVQQQVNVVKQPSKGLTIRGLAGPFTVMAQNFAPGTTLADIESAMTPIGGEISSSRLVKTSPIIVAELVFVSREGGESVIETFNDKTADGRIIKVYAKPGGSRSSPAATADREGVAHLNPPTGPRSTRSTTNKAAEGSKALSDLTATSGANDSGNGRLYSDKIVAGNRRGRGFQRGRGGR